MSTPNRRPTERTLGFTTKKGDFVPLPPLSPDTRTARDLAADPRVARMDFDAVPGKVVVVLNDRWSYAEVNAAQGLQPHIRSFDLWERARNAVRRANGPSLRELKAEHKAAK
jgi:hypothetical protein